MECRAEDAEYLLNKYGKSQGLPIKSEYVEKLTALETELAMAEWDKAMVDEYNGVIDSIREYNEYEQSLIDKDIDTLMNTNRNIAKNIGQSLYTEDIDSLINMDRQYKTNILNVNKLFANRELLDEEYIYKEYSYDMESVKQEYSEVQDLYEEAITTFDLGEVNEVPFPMKRDRYVTSKYGNRVDPLNTSKTRFHSGTDYRAATGTELYALFNGTVTSCGWSDTSGYFIVIQSGDRIKTFVCHLSEIKVTKGQVVSQGELIALTGGTGSRSTGPHLHLALYIDGATYDVDRLWQ